MSLDSKILQTRLAPSRFEHGLYPGRPLETVTPLTKRQQKANMAGQRYVTRGR